MQPGDTALVDTNHPPTKPNHVIQRDTLASSAGIASGTRDGCIRPRLGISTGTIGTDTKTCFGQTTAKAAMEWERWHWAGYGHGSS